MLNKTLFVILSCDKYIGSRVNSVRTTWAKTTNRIFIVDSSSEISDLIGYNTSKNYEGIQDKYLNFFKYYDFESFDYYFFVDDDTFVNLKNYSNFEFPSSNESVVIGRVGVLNPDATDISGNFTGYPLHTIKGHNTNLPLSYVGGGAGFILTKASCNLIKNYLLTTEYEIPTSNHGDVTLGFWFRNSGISLISSDKLWWSTPDDLIKNPINGFKNDDTFLTYHYVNHEMMIELNQKYN